LSLELYQCDYDSTPDLCASKSEIEEFTRIKKLNLALLVIDYQVSVTDFSNPKNIFFNNPYKFITKDLKVLNYLIQQDTIKTDSGLIFESITETKSLKTEELQNDVSLFSREDKQVINWNFYSSNQTKIYSRKYIKLSEIMASVGGLLKIFISLFVFINIPFCNINKIQKIMEKIFFKDVNLSKEKVLTDNYLRSPPIEILHSSDILNNKKEFLRERIKNYKNSKFNIKLSLWNKLRIALCKKKIDQPKNVRLFLLAQNEIESNTDFLSVYKSLKSLELMKKILLEEHQRQILSIYKTNITKLKVKKCDSEKINENEIVSKMRFSNVSEIDKRLIELLF
jgi:hypothetical protein